jgi:hypothetical protein
MFIDQMRDDERPVELVFVRIGGTGKQSSDFASTSGW